jgi:hypothetical protein
MSKYRILLDSNVYLRIGNSFHPLLNKSFGQKNYTLYLIPEFKREFDKNPRLINKFGWVNQPEYIENRKNRFRILSEEKDSINIAYSYLWAQNISEGLGASRIDISALAYGSVLDVPVVTDDSDMIELAEPFGIEVWGLIKLLDIMLESNRIKKPDIKTLIEYLEYNKDLPYSSFKKRAERKFKITF